MTRVVKSVYWVHVHVIVHDGIPVDGTLFTVPQYSNWPVVANVIEGVVGGKSCIVLVVVLVHAVPLEMMYIAV